MSEILERGHLVYCQSFDMFWELKAVSGSGYGFRCDENGIINVEELQPAGLEILQYCKDHPELYNGPKLVKYEWHYYQPTVIKCSCGRRLDLHDPLTNECVCGRLYNGSAQELAPRCQWEEHDDPYEDLSDLADLAY